MKIRPLLFFIPIMAVCHGAHGAAACSRAALTKCLDSACAINIGANPAARCQYCGTDSAGEPPADTGLRSVSVGQSSKNTITDKELKKAPTAPGDRYAWATAQCIAKIPGCTADDVSETYDTLIEQSCKAAGISAQMASLQAAARKTKSQSTCASDIRACVVASNRCGGNFAACESNADFDKFFAACSVDASGCDDYISTIRTDLIAARDTAIKNADTMLASIVAAYQDARAKKLAAATADCTDNRGRDTCVETVCARNMSHKCSGEYENAERSMALQLCKFYDTACGTLKR